MTLVSRVSAFFLTALAIALICYSAIFYFWIRDYLYQQFDEDLHGALQILAASVEVEPDDAKWDPAEHGVDFREGKLNDVLWFVCDERGQVIDRSPALERSDSNYEQALKIACSVPADIVDPIEFGPWRLLAKEMSAPAPKPLVEREPHEYASLRIAVMRSQTELTLLLNRLAWLMCLIPALVWLAAAGIGRWYVRRALHPVRDMAQKAQSATQADFSLRLPVGKSHDELAELGRSFNHLLAQLQSAFDRQSRFTGDAAHQLRNPLTALQGQIDVAQRWPRTTEEYQQTLRILAEQTLELRQIVESLLFLARTEDDAARPTFEDIDLDDWLPQFVARWKDHPRTDNISLRAYSQATISASPTLLTQLLDNLLSNALKYSQPGSGVVIAAERVDAHVKLLVMDRGIGISSIDQSTIFEPFFRSEDTRLRGIPGTGLGLSVAARIASAFNGTLSCESTPGRGSTFTLLLPAAEVG